MSTTASTSVPPVPVPAFKEWAVIVRALLAGEQIIDVRKGGLREDGRHFDLRSTRLWLWPTTEHQRPELLKPPYRHWVDDRTGPATGSPPGAPVRIPGWAEVVGHATISEPGDLDALDSKSIWAREYVESRLRWKRRDPLWVLVLRAHLLTEPREVPWHDDYAGCTSWVDVDGLPADPASAPSEPALSDGAFEARLKGVLDALPAGAFTAA